MLNILHVTSEVTPYSKSGGLAHVLGALPKAQRLLGHSISVLSPLYPGVDARTGPLSRPVNDLTLQIGRSRRTGVVRQFVGHDGVRQFFLDMPELYDRPGLYGDNGADYEDNGQRFAALSKAAISMAIQYDMGFDVFHCHDWQSALTPVYRQTTKDPDGDLAGLGVVLTIHNLAFQGTLPADQASKLGVPKKYLSGGQSLEAHGQLNLLKGGLVFADQLTTVSPTYADEICTEPFGCGLHDTLQRRRADLSGILNGVDYSQWSPDCDALLPFQFTAEKQNGKRRCKAELQARFKLHVRPRLPLIGVVARLTEQKGIDLLIEAVRPLLQDQQTQLVILGEGQAELETGCRELAQAFPQAVGVEIGYVDDLAHLIFGGADLFAMPSRFEPCGLSQMYAMRYGSIPVVRNTGGLRDTVEDYDPEDGSGTGFHFDEPSATALQEALRDAIEVYHHVRRWRQLITQAMRTDFSWKRAAEDYERVYERVLENSGD